MKKPEPPESNLHPQLLTQAEGFSVQSEVPGGSPQQEHCWQPRAEREEDPTLGRVITSAQALHPVGLAGVEMEGRATRPCLSNSILGSRDACSTTLTRDGRPTPIWVTCYQPQVTQSVQGLLPNIHSQSIIHLGRVSQGEEELHRIKLAPGKTGESE